MEDYLMGRLFRILTGLAVVLILIISACMYQLREGQVVVVTRLGEYIGTEIEAGLHFRYPWPVGKIYRFDNRLKVMESSFTETLTRDQRNVILLNYATWQISNPLKFLESVRNVETAEMRLDKLITDAKNAVMGNYELSALVSTESEQLRVPEIESEILAMVQESARDDYGVEIQDIAILRLALPENNIARVFEQMRAERQQYAKRYEAEGQEESQAIRSAADLERAEILAEAIETSAGIRAAADAEAARIYADAHSQDLEFYKFLRSLEALKAILSQNTTLVVDTDAPPFDLLEE